VTAATANLGGVHTVAQPREVTELSARHSRHCQERLSETSVKKVDDPEGLHGSVTASVEARAAANMSLRSEAIFASKPEILHLH